MKGEQYNGPEQLRPPEISWGVGLAELRDFARGIPINCIQTSPSPLYFHSEVSCFKFHHLKIMIFIMIFFFYHFSCFSFGLKSVPWNIQKACALTSFQEKCSLTIYLKLQYISPISISYSLPVFLHRTYRYLTCNPLNLFDYFLSLSPPEGEGRDVPPRCLPLYRPAPGTVRSTLQVGKYLSNE